ncbi:SDR family NAD(P)-dependent oxidoreductase [Phenylobacterium montanum]|uniref:SDR family NAD(P)-dependent oxidoreductase n=1 Tax=Phenylobacterium montanum TaxID=2823693 RepID=A0A975IXR5_9CAUL|nr:SDR family NAD(P)-dependent oxidoreductase [Caulobacter sp. S6]QUD89686.1 SDR family NAD(P)-dependent oxidoreductase [Caulobacter sp. S6]
MQIKDKRALVTGAGSGIGRETALALARADAKVVATDVSLAGLAELKADAAREGLTIDTLRLDVADRPAYDALAAELQSQDRLPQILINNAGVGYFGALLDTPLEVYERVLRINVLGVVNGCQVFGPAMVESGEPGCIVNVSSTASAIPIPNMNAYAASKWAVEGLSDGLAMELSRSSVHVISVHPGIINTAIVPNPMGAAPSITREQLDGLSAYYAKNGCHPRVVADAIVAAVRSGKDKVFVGPSAQFGAVARRFAPTRMKRRLTLSVASKIGFWK